MLGSAGDHAGVYHLLSTIFQSPTYDDYLSTLDDPFYEPNDRILVKQGHQILAHVYVAKRAMHFGDRQLPISVVNGLATIPESRQAGYGRRLMALAEEAIRNDGSVLGVLRTKIPYFFRSCDWALCGRHCVSRARTRDVLAQISQREAPAYVQPDVPLRIRPWRQVELPSLMRLYQGTTSLGHGAYDRTEAYWRWLISRKAFDHIFVAVKGPDKFDLDDNESIVGYVFTRQDQVLELMADPRYPSAHIQLLARACGEAIERDAHAISYQGPSNDPLHQLFRQAGGEVQHNEWQQGEVTMVKLFEPWVFLQSLLPELHRRAELAALTRPTELGLCVDGQKYLLVLSRRSAKLQSGRLGRSYLTCNGAELTRMLLGHADLREASEQGRVEPSTRVALELGRVLFPELPMWRSMLDDLIP
jgi:predicted acetyltransferase